MALHRRSFVSTVLLSRTWESETLVVLRSEAKARGISTRGNKSTLIARIKEHEQNAASSTNTHPAVRTASTHVNPPVRPQKSVQAAAPGIPLAAQPDRAPAPSGFLHIKLPVSSRPPPDAPVQVPYVPDFWNSAQPKANPPVQLEPPRLHVVGGSATHYDGGPTHNLEKPQEGDSSPTIAKPANPPASGVVGFWADFWQSLGLPRSFSPRPTLSKLGNLATPSERDEPRAHSRPLTNEERRGLYVLLGIVGGSWLVGGLVNRTTAVGEEHYTPKQR